MCQFGTTKQRPPRRRLRGVIEQVRPVAAALVFRAILVTLAFLIVKILLPAALAAA